MTLTVFASGSGGNCALLSDGETHVLLDAGISLRRITHALAAHGLTVEDLDGVLITHEHKDHVSAVPVLCRHHDTALYAPRTVANHIRWSAAGVDAHLREIEPGIPFPLGGFTVTAFLTPHDTDVSVGYRVEGNGCFGLCTDAGHVTEEMTSALTGCGAVMVETNHDTDMLLSGPYPAVLKRRILSDRGHLSNECGAALCRELAERGTRRFVLAHLSQENNRPFLARAAVERALKSAEFGGVELDVAPVLGDLCVEIPPCRVMAGLPAREAASCWE